MVLKFLKKSSKRFLLLKFDFLVFHIFSWFLSIAFTFNFVSYKEKNIGYILSNEGLTHVFWVLHKLISSGGHYKRLRLINRLNLLQFDGTLNLSIKIPDYKFCASKALISFLISKLLNISDLYLPSICLGHFFYCLLILLISFCLKVIFQWSSIHCDLLGY